MNELQEDGYSGQKNRRAVVSVVYRYVPAYRAPFYEALRVELAAVGVELRLIYGQPTGRDVSRGDAATIGWGTRIRNRVLRIGSKDVIWQPALPHLRGSDLIIVEQASRLLLNYVLSFGRRCGLVKRIAYWGHGRNFQQDSASALAEWIKRRASVRADWWFAYNAASVDIVKSLGFPPERITDVQNAIDDSSLRASLEGVTPSRLDEFRRRFGIEGRNICVFIGSLYPDKRLGYLLDAAEIIRSHVGDFELLVVGAGPDEGVLRAFATERPWVHELGFQDSEVRACALRASRLMLIPGAVGLAVIDSFVSECPLVTVAGRAHGPEYGYLADGVNGISLSEDSTALDYAEIVIGLLGDDAALERLREGCSSRAGSLTLEQMVNRFAGGIMSALQAGSRPAQGGPEPR